MKTVYRSDKAEDTVSFGFKLGRLLKKGSVVAMKGALGSGKTVLAKGIALGLGIEDSVTSPTFTIISEYEGSLPLYHMDLYRINSIEEFEDLGADELLHGNGVCIIEWSEKVESVLPEHIEVNINVGPNGSRLIEVKGIEI